MLLLQWNARPIVALRTLALLQPSALAMDVEFEVLRDRKI